MRMKTARMTRLNKYMAECGVGARRKCDEIIAQGRVAVNGKFQKELGLKIDEAADNVHVDGRLLRRVERYEYVILNKPKGLVTTAADEKSRRTVLDLVRFRTRLFPVGRLDVDTTGLLLLTNDGNLAYRLTHPKFHVQKVYEVRLNSDLSRYHKQDLEAGIQLEEGKTAPCKMEYIDFDDRRRVRVTLYQGWNRQMRRMFEKVGYEVRGLRRCGFASLNLRGLKIGAWRRLLPQEVARLKSITVAGSGNRIPPPTSTASA